MNKEVSAHENCNFLLELYNLLMYQALPTLPNVEDISGPLS